VKNYNRIRDLIVKIDAIGPIQVFDGEKWFEYISMELKHEALTLFVATTEDYFTHESLSITEVKGFRAVDKREKMKPILAELKIITGMTIQGHEIP
jgi:hypothetical protein|tara:strand:+ start:36 stop:323 length:288 start_codon:yes stop_codon:yes gene_type:complete